MLTNWRRVAPIAAVVVVVGAAMLVASRPSGDADRPDPQPMAAIEAINARNDGLLWLRQVSHLADLVPSTVLEYPDGRRVRLVDALVLGRIVRVEHGKARRHEEDGSQEVDFASSSADTRTLHLVLDVEEAFGGPSSKTTRVGLVVGGRADFDEVARSLIALGRVLVPIAPGGAVFDYERGLGEIAQGGELLGTVDDHGVIRLPALAEAAEFLGDVDTIDELRVAADEAPLVIPVDRGGTPLAWSDG
jgi:hypothetical protein